MSGFESLYRCSRWIELHRLLFFLLQFPHIYGIIVYTYDTSARLCFLSHTSLPRYREYRMRFYHFWRKFWVSFCVGFGTGLIALFCLGSVLFALWLLFAT